MSKGYLVIAQNSGDIDYLTQAYALALSLKATQSEVNGISVCVDKETKKCVTAKHRRIFDAVIEIPWQDAAAKTQWKIDNKWKYYHMTPYAETVILDTDMVFPRDVSHWWDLMGQKDVWATTNVRTFRNEIVTSDYYRPSVRQNNMANIYTAFFYFKQSDLARELFKMIEIIFNNWQRYFFKYMPKGKPDRLSGDIAYALAMKILGVEDLCTEHSIKEFPTFVHMKSKIQNIEHSLISEKWIESIPTYYKSCSYFKVGNFLQTYPFHYVEPDWLTPEILSSLEKEAYQ